MRTGTGHGRPRSGPGTAPAAAPVNIFLPPASVGPCPGPGPRTGRASPESGTGRDPV